jgi:hypothetical protein
LFLGDLPVGENYKDFFESGLIIPSDLLFGEKYEIF